MSEGYIQLPTDGSGQKLRDFETTEYDSSGNPYTVVHEAVALVDDEGNALYEGGTGAKVIPISSEEINEKLDMIAVGLAHLILLLQEVGGPISGLHKSATDWVSQALGDNT